MRDTPITEAGKSITTEFTSLEEVLDTLKESIKWDEIDTVHWMDSNTSEGDDGLCYCKDCISKKVEEKQSKIPKGNQDAQFKIHGGEKDYSSNHPLFCEECIKPLHYTPSDHCVEESVRYLMMDAEDIDMKESSTGALYELYQTIYAINYNINAIGLAASDVDKNRELGLRVLTRLNMQGLPDLSSQRESRPKLRVF